MDGTCPAWPHSALTLSLQFSKLLKPLALLTIIGLLEHRYAMVPDPLLTL
jgi:hypothetical protein